MGSLTKRFFNCERLEGDPYLVSSKWFLVLRTSGEFFFDYFEPYYYIVIGKLPLESVFA